MSPCQQDGEYKLQRERWSQEHLLLRVTRGWLYGSALETSDAEPTNHVVGWQIHASTARAGMKRALAAVLLLLAEELVSHEEGAQALLHSSLPAAPAAACLGVLDGARQMQARVQYQKGNAAQQPRCASARANAATAHG